MYLASWTGDSELQSGISYSATRISSVRLFRQRVSWTQSPVFASVKVQQHPPALQESHSSCVSQVRKGAVQASITAAALPPASALQAPCLQRTSPPSSFSLCRSSQTAMSWLSAVAPVLAAALDPISDPVIGSAIDSAIGGGLESAQEPPSASSAARWSSSTKFVR